MKHAPKSYEHGKTYKMPFGMSSRPYWELIEPVPVFVAPEPSDEDSVFVDIEGDDVVFIDPGLGDEEHLDINLELDAPASISSSLDYIPSEDEMSQYTASTPSLEEHEEAEILELSPIEGESHTAEFETVTVKIEPVETVDRDALKRVLDEAGIEYKPRARTATLQTQVDELATEEYLIRFYRNS